MNQKYPDHESLKKANSDFEDNMPRGYENYPLIFGKLFNILVEIPKQGKLLDCGCNSGEISRMIKDFTDLDVTAVDISYKVVKLAKDKGINAVCADAENMPFEDNTFDCVWIGEMIEHTFEPEKILKEIKRVLKPGGKLVGATIDEETLLCLGMEWDDDRLHARPYGPETMGEMLSSEFKNVAVYRNICRDMSDDTMNLSLIFRGYK